MALVSHAPMATDVSSDTEDLEAAPTTTDGYQPLAVDAVRPFRVSLYFHTLLLIILPLFMSRMLHHGTPLPATLTPIEPYSRSSS